jgi:hypothetical protein
MFVLSLNTFNYYLSWLLDLFESNKYFLASTKRLSKKLPGHLYDFFRCHFFAFVRWLVSIFLSTKLWLLFFTLFWRETYCHILAHGKSWSYLKEKRKKIVLLLFLIFFCYSWLCCTFKVLLKDNSFVIVDIL